jgi:hypothetical protein
MTVLSIAWVLVVVGCTQADDNADIASDTDSTSGSQPIFVSADSSWSGSTSIQKNAPGVQLATLWGILRMMPSGPSCCSQLDSRRRFTRTRTR